MRMLVESVLSLIGNTPILELKHLKSDLCLKADIFAKLEKQNPGGSVKDRIALAMIEQAEADGTVGEGSTIIEPTSGNTGLGLCMVCAVKGYRLILTMPENMSEERKKLFRFYGAELVQTPRQLRMQGAIDKARELAAQISNSFIPLQFDNMACVRAHYRTTGPEIWNDLGGNIDVFIAGVGTGGTISGAGGYLKEKNKKVAIIAVEPDGSAVLSGENPGAHNIQGIGAGFVPSILNTKIIDKIFRVAEDDAYRAGLMLARSEGIFCGISSGAALFAAIETAKKPEFAGTRIVVVLPDTGERYLSTEYVDF